MQERIYNGSRGNVHYWITEKFDAESRTLVFLHGLSANHTLFDKQVEYFNGKYNLLVWDAPAHSASRPYSDFTYPSAAEDLKGILDENGIESAVMIGQSMGGYVIQSFLLRYPKRVTAFISIDSCPYGEDYYSKSDKWWLRQIEWMMRLYPLKALKKAIAKQCTKTQYAYDNMLNAVEPYEKKEFCHLIGIGYAGFLADNRDMEIKCPTLLLVGEYDKTGKVLAYCKAWAKKTGFPLHAIKNAAHNANADAPEAVNAEIESFLRVIEHSYSNET